MYKIKSWPKLIFSILLAQSAGGIGTFFTFDAIPTWYALLNKPTFSTPNWLFGPVWTILYTLIGISFYLIWTNKKGSLKLFFIHLFLNAIWSPIFFGVKNLGLAFLVIILMDVTLIVIIKNFYKINKVAAIILIPYLLWISFASLLNFSIWKLNPTNQPSDIFAQELTFSKSKDDYIFSDDVYRKDLADFNLKKAAYQKNETLALKEESRLALYKFVSSRNNLVKSYLNMIRAYVSESKGIDNSLKTTIYSKIDPEIKWFEERKNSYSVTGDLETIINKSQEEDTKYKTEVLPIIYFSLANISLGEVNSAKEDHIKIYNSLKTESDEIVKLGRADKELFNRWFSDINNELNNINDAIDKTKTEINKILNGDDYTKDSGYKKSIESLEITKSYLLKLNSYISELENTLESKR